VLNDESGLVLCTWPRGGKPSFPFEYSDEVWTGIEYAVAALLIYEGFVDEAITIVQAVRRRQDGYRRSPWNEVECGHHYARSMSSWALLLALSGFHCDLDQGMMSFDPVFKISTESNKFKTFWSNGAAWGTIEFNQDPKTEKWVTNLEVIYGDQKSVTGFTWTGG
jgi:hypothetical protein